MSSTLSDAPRWYAADRDDEAAIKEDFDELFERFGRAPTQREYLDHGAFSLFELVSTFSEKRTYNDAVSEMGYPPSYPRRGRTAIPLCFVAEDFDRVVDELGYVPTSGEYNDNGAFSITSLVNKFSPGTEKSYAEAVRTLGYEPPACSVRREVTAEDVKRDFARVREELGRSPTSPEYQNRGKHSLMTLKKKWSETNRYGDAVMNMGFDYY